jgi:hypothetical protein
MSSAAKKAPKSERRLRASKLAEEDTPEFWAEDVRKRLHEVLEALAEQRSRADAVDSLLEALHSLTLLDERLERVLPTAEARSTK